MIEIVDRGPHEYVAKPTKRLPHRSQCVWCGAYSDVRAAGIIELRLCPSNGDEQQDLDVDGFVARIWRARRSRGPVVAVVETEWARWSWEASPTRGTPSHEYLRGFVVGVISSRGAPVPDDGRPGPPLPKNVIVVRFGASP